MYEYKKSSLLHDKVMKESMSSKMDKLRNNKLVFRPIMIIASLFVGIANGFFGGGGGMLVIPILTFLCGMQQKKAHATAVAIILPLSIASTIMYLVNGIFEWKSAVSVSSGVVVGGIIGSLLLSKISNKWLSYVFYIIMLAGGIKMVIG